MNQSKTKIYIAGKVTGVPLAECRKKFDDMHTTLEARGFEVINPMVVVANPETSWPEAMEMCLNALDTCEAIYMLPCSVDSPGAQMELDYALKKETMTIYHELENVE
jgi:hypothetical protein